jgi:carbonic anhydrase/acetyltransferase-like protein (isoleucine patch superfamily)
MIHAVGDKRPRIDPTAIVHPMATVMGDVVLGPEVTVWPGAVLRGDFAPIVVGARTCVQDNVVLHTGDDGTEIGVGCVIGHLVHVEGATIEDGVLVGIGARILDRVILRQHSVVAAGAVVTPDTEVPTGMRAQGVPAKLVQGSTPTREMIEQGVQDYIDMARVIERSLREEGPMDGSSSI